MMPQCFIFLTHLVSQSQYIHHRSHCSPVIFCLFFEQGGLQKPNIPPPHPWIRPCHYINSSRNRLSAHRMFWAQLYESMTTIIDLERCMSGFAGLERHVAQISTYPPHIIYKYRLFQVHNAYIHT